MTQTPELLPEMTSLMISEAGPELAQEMAALMVPEMTRVDRPAVWCDGAGDIRSGANFRPAALGHPRVYLQIDETGFADCGYCDRRFILAGGPADGTPDNSAR